MSKIDPVTLEVDWNRLITIMDEVDVALVRTSFSTIVGESRDFAVIMLDREGHSLAQSQLSSPAFTCMLPVTTKHFLKEFADEGLSPGDVLITNDPWLATGHLPDLSIVMPVFHEDEMVAFMAAAAHVADIGGRLDFFDARDLFEEGLQIPPSKLFSKGEPNHQLLRMIEANVRVPTMVLGDIFAIVGAQKIGAERLQTLVKDRGVAHFDMLGTEILARSEDAMRRAIEALPDGEYEYVQHADGYKDPLRIQARVTIAGSNLTVDYTGSSPQFPDASINCVPNTTYADTIYPIKCSLTPDLPNNEGLFQPIAMHAPIGSVLNTTYPSPVKSRSKTSFHIHMAIYGALSGAMPDRVQAGSGAFWAVTVVGRNGDEPFNVHILPNGGKGATAQADGLPTIAFPYNGTVTPTEIIENQAPIVIEWKRFLPDSAGPGQHRGGMAQELALRVRGHDNVVVSVRPDKMRFPAPGIRGGQPGRLGSFTLNGQTVSAEPHRLRDGDLLIIQLPGGGGFGPPSERDPSAVFRDVLDGVVTPAEAREQYGVEVDIALGTYLQVPGSPDGSGEPYAAATGEQA